MALGRVTLPPVAAPGFALYVKKPGYDDRRLEIFELPRQTALDVWVYREPVTQQEHSGSCGPPMSRTIPIAVPREGRMRALRLCRELHGLSARSAPTCSARPKITLHAFARPRRSNNDEPKSSLTWPLPALLQQHRLHEHAWRHLASPAGVPAMTKSMARLGRLSICAVGMLAGCDKAVEPPTTPTGATLQSVTIAGLPAELAVGDRAQLTARATWSDARTEDVTARARWTSASGTCLITPAAMISATEPGACAITAAVDAVSGRAAATVTPARSFTISGVVREKYQLREPPLAGAAVTLASGAQAGRTATADSLGRYVFEGVPTRTRDGTSQPGGLRARGSRSVPGRAAGGSLSRPCQRGAGL